MAYAYMAYASTACASWAFIRFGLHLLVPGQEHHNTPQTLH